MQPSEFPGQRKIVALSELASLAPVSSNLNSSSSYPSKSVPALDSHPLSASFKILVPAAFATCWLLASLVLTVRLMISLGAGHRIARDSRFRNKSGFADCAFRIGSCPGCSNRPSTPSVRLGPMPHDLVLGCGACALCAPIGGRDARSRLAECLLSRAGDILIRRDHWSALWTQNPRDRRAVATAGVAFTTTARVSAGAGLR